MITRAALCPSPPLLVRELTGRDPVAGALRDACATAVARLVAARADLVIVAGAGPATRTWDPGGRLDPRAYGLACAAGGEQGLPLALGLGALLLEGAGYTGPRLLQAVGESESPARCLKLGASLADAAPTVGLLAVGDGSARRGPAAPGHFDERAAPFDDAVRSAISCGDMAALAALDAALAGDLMATGRAAWQVLAGALGGSLDAAPAARPAAEILYADDPFGVAYLVAVLDRAADAGGGARACADTCR